MEIKTGSQAAGKRDVSQEQALKSVRKPVEEQSEEKPAAWPKAEVAPIDPPAPAGSDPRRVSAVESPQTKPPFTMEDLAGYPQGGLVGFSQTKTEKVDRAELTDEDRRADEAAWFFLDRLSEGSHRTMVEDLMTEDKMTAAQVVYGFMVAALENRLIAFVRRSKEDDGLDLGKRMTMALEKPCEFCQEIFEPIRGGQRFCCNACGVRSEGSPSSVDHTDECLLKKQAA